MQKLSGLLFEVPLMLLSVNFEHNMEPTFIHVLSLVVGLQPHCLMPPLTPAVLSKLQFLV